MFTTLDLSLNQYHHVFFQVEPDKSDVLTTYMYDNAMNYLGRIDVSFGDQSIVSALTSFDQSGANPYAIGVDHTGSTKVNMDLAFWGMYTSALKLKQHQTLMKFTNQTLLEPHSQATIYIVTVENGKFYVDDDAQPILVFAPGYYVFDQRHASNANHPLLLSTTANGIHGGGTEYTTGVVKNGTPGSLNAYTLIQVTENTPDLFYYCANHSNMMGGPFTQVDTVYYVKVVQNVLGEYVYALSTSASGPYYNQMDLSFNAGEKYLFNVGDSSNDGYRLEFGTTVDDVATINTANVVRDEDEIVLNLSGYTGDALYYFEDTSAGMGYVKYVASTNTSSLIDLETEVVNDNYSMEDKTDVNGITKNSFHVSNKQVIPGPNSTTNLILNSSNGNGYMVYMFWAYVYDDVGNTAAPTHETVNGNLANIFNPGASFLGFSNRALCFLNGDITNFPDYKASTAISAETWTHCAIVLEFSTGRFKAYYNGNEQSVTTNQYSGNTGDFYVQINSYSYGNIYNPNIPVYINDLHISNSASSFTEAENIIIGSLSKPTVVYDVTVAGGVFDVSGTPQLNVQFAAYTNYIFDQSDHTNDGYQIVFGTEPDASMNYTTGKTIMGTPGQEGAYTKLDLPANFSGPLFYYHDTIPYMGYGPLLLSVDNNSASNGDVVTFTVTNRTGVAETYTITGVVSADISGASLSGLIGYGQEVDLSYVITGSGKTMVFSVGDLSANVNINPDYNTAIEYEFAVQTNAIGDPVFAVYDVSDSVYYNQPDLSFAALYLYQIDLSSSVTNGGYTLVFGTEVDNSGTVVESGFVTRDTQNNSVTLDLRTYTGDPLVYFEDVSAGMGYIKSPSETVVYDVSISGGVFDLSGTPQLNVQFTAETTYVFDQSDPTNSGHTLVFGRNPDTTPLFTDGVTVMGEAGRAGAYTQLDLSAGFTGDLYYFSDASANMGMIVQQPIIADATNDWIGSSNQDDPQFTLANFLSFVQNKGITVTGSNISDFNAIGTVNNISYYVFPNGDKNFRFWASGNATCWLDFTAPFSGTCELKYGNNYDQTRIYLNNFTNYIDRIGPGNGSTFTSKTHTFSVTQGDTIRLEEFQSSVSYFYHIKFTP